jgi:hypothetical protein
MTNLTAKDLKQKHDDLNSVLQRKQQDMLAQVEQLVHQRCITYNLDVQRLQMISEILVNLSKITNINVCKVENDSQNIDEVDLLNNECHVDASCATVSNDLSKKAGINELFEEGLCSQKPSSAIDSVDQLNEDHWAATDLVELDTLIIGMARDVANCTLHILSTSQQTPSPATFSG